MCECVCVWEREREFGWLAICRTVCVCVCVCMCVCPSIYLYPSVYSIIIIINHITNCTGSFLKTVTSFRAQWKVDLSTSRASVSFFPLPCGVNCVATFPSVTAKHQQLDNFCITAEKTKFRIIIIIIIVWRSGPLWNSATRPLAQFCATPVDLVSSFANFWWWSSWRLHPCLLSSVFSVVVRPSYYRVHNSGSFQACTLHKTQPTDPPRFDNSANGIPRDGTAQYA